MHCYFQSIAVSSLLAVLTSTTLATPFQNIVTLGDSLLDDPEGTRSPVAAEHLARRLGVPVTKLAQSGASSSELLASGQHTQAAANFGESDLATLWIGGNDFFDSALGITFGLYGFLDELESNVDTILGTLRATEMEVMVFNLPDMSAVPVTLGISNFRKATLQWNNRLNALATQHGAHVVDVFSLFEEIVDQPDDFSLRGNTPVLGPSYDCQFCVFADPVHPSSYAQGYIANEAIEVFNSSFDPNAQMPVAPLTSSELAILADLPPADFNGNNLVDADDLKLWQSAFAQDNLGDADGDNDSDGHDFLAWQEQHGSGVGAPRTSRPVPEPCSTVPLLLGVTLAAIGIRRYETPDGA